MGFPERTCLGEKVEGFADIRNTSDCAGVFRVRFIPDKGEEWTSDEIELNPGDRTSLDFNVREMPDRPLAIEQQLELKSGDDWIPIATRENRIEPLFSDFQFVSTPYPQFVQPGDPVTANLTVQNVGDCDGEVELGGTRLNNVSFGIAPGNTQTFNHRFDMPGEAQSIGLNLRDLTRNRQADAFSGRVQPQQTVLIDKANGAISFVGGFQTSIPYRGVVQGRNIRGDDLETDDTVRGRNVTAFSGSVSTSPSDTDTIKFDRLDFLDMRFDRDIQWVLDKEILGKQQSFRWSSYPLGLVEAALPTINDEPGHNIRASVGDRINQPDPFFGVGSRVNNAFANIAGGSE